MIGKRITFCLTVVHSITTRLPTVLACALIVCFVSIDATAQRRKPNTLPRVGTIKDYPATGLMTGCGNLYFYRVGESKSSDANYVFLSSGDGSNAWMNLGGRDLRLREDRASAHEGKKGRRFYYHVHGINISVVIEQVKPQDGQTAGDDSMFKMKITLRKGRAVRTIQAVGDADC